MKAPESTSSTQATATAAPAAAPSVTPAVAPAAAPVEPAKAVDPAPAADPAKPAEAPKVEEPKVEDEGSLLDEAFAELDGKKPEAEAPKVEGDKEPAKEEEKKPEGAPEKYELQFPEGSKVDQEALEQFHAVAKELNISQQAAQKLVDMQVQLAKQAHDQAVSQYKEMVKGWTQETKKLLGADYKRELSYAARFINKFGPPGAREFLNQSGMGNHPIFNQMMIAAGKAISEDKLIEGEGAGSKNALDLLYPNQPK